MQSHRTQKPCRCDWAFVFLGLLLMVGCGQPKGDSVVVFCASSLGNVVQQVCASENLTASLHQAGSYTLVRQLEQGAHADLVLLADPRARTLLSAGLDTLDVARNRLVLVAPSRSSLSPSDLSTVLEGGKGKLALADPKSAPLGRYSRQALENIDLAGYSIVPLKNANAVAGAVALGHADLGVVYASDATGNSRLKILAELPQSSHEEILYSAVLIDPDNQAASRLFRALSGQTAQALFREQGFPAFP